MGGHRDLLGEIQDRFALPGKPSEQYSALGLAYIGDGVYDLIIRTIVLDLGGTKVNALHRMTSGIVKAESQAALMREMMEYLTPEEESVFRRGRNAKSATSAKNASIVDYRVATGFEALIGYLYLRHDTRRILELVQIGLEKTGQMPGGQARTEGHI